MTDLKKMTRRELDAHLADLHSRSARGEALHLEIMQAKMEIRVRNQEIGKTPSKKGR